MMTFWAMRPLHAGRISFMRPGAGRPLLASSSSLTSSHMQAQKKEPSTQMEIDDSSGHGTNNNQGILGAFAPSRSPAALKHDLQVRLSQEDYVAALAVAEEAELLIQVYFMHVYIGTEI